jgi:hypothetical protein
MSGLLCSGNVNIALLNDDGTFKGYLPIKNTVSLALNPGAVNTQERVSRMIDNFGQNLDTVNIPGGPTLSLEVDDVDADTVGMSFRGDVTALNLPAITAVESTVTVAPGLYFPLAPAGYKVTAVGVKDSAGVTSFTLGSDYTIDSDGAMIYIVPAGTIVAGDIKVTLSAVAVTGKRINPATKPALRVGVRGRMKNLATGKFVIVNVPDASVSPGENVDFLAAQFAVNKMTGPIRTTVGQAPYTVDFID